MSASPGPSAYAAPNSPIASSKRPRIATTPKIVYSPAPGLKSPTKLTNGDAGSSSNDCTSQTTEGVNGTSSQNRSETACCDDDGGKPALFSPNLKKTEEFDDKGNTESSEEEDDGDDNIDDEDVFNPYLFIATLPEVSGTDMVCLPPKSVEIQKRTLVLDLDETLVHCCVEPIENPDLVFPVTFNGNFYQVYVRKRPHLDRFLEIVSERFEVVVFTASQKVYANTLLNLLDPQSKYIHHRLFREACVLVHGNYLKDLTVLGRDLSKSVLVDNSPHAYGFQIENGIPIESWFDDDADNELLSLLDFLESVRTIEDVRPLIKERFRTCELVDKARNTLRNISKVAI